VEQLAGIKRLSDSGGEVEARHLLVSSFWVQTNHLWVVKGLNESKRVTNGWQQNVATWLVWLWLNRKLDSVVLVNHVLTEQVHGLAVAA
jgi:hypothetical protein